jgi:predicted acetyltransferase
MNSRDLELRPVRPEDERTFLEAVNEFRTEVPPWDFALGSKEGETFLQYIKRQEAWSRGEDLPPGFVAGGFYVGVVSGRVVGRVSIRYKLNEFLSKLGGHIGYGVRASERRRGYATRMLQLALPICRTHGIERALVTCDVDNVGSRGVIERCGGICIATAASSRWLQFGSSSNTLVTLGVLSGYAFHAFAGVTGVLFILLGGASVVVRTRK